MDLGAIAAAGEGDIFLRAPAHSGLSLRTAKEAAEPADHRLDRLPCLRGPQARCPGEVIKGRLKVLLRRTTWIVGHGSTVSSVTGQEKCRVADFL